jgi:SAM-dependent methyltransferase
MLEIRHNNQSNFRKAYDSLYENRSLQHRDSYYMWLLSLLPLDKGKKLLDISCGEGRLVEIASELGLRATGVDFSFTGIHDASQKTPQANWVVGDGQKLPFATNQFDYVTNIGSLEHYENPLLGSKEIARVLKPNGRACILLPNAFGLMGNIRYVKNNGEIFDDGQPLQRYATRQTWEFLLESGGLEIERIVPYGEVVRPRTLKDALWLIKRPLKFVRMLIAILTPLNLANHFVFICHKAQPETRFRPRSISTIHENW